MKPRLLKINGHLVAALAILVLSPALAGAALTTVIDHVPYTITEAGHYELQSDLTANDTAIAIAVQKADVVIDLNGFTLAESPAGLSDIGIYVTANNVTIRNGTVSRFGTGITLSSSQCVVEGLRLLCDNGVTVVTGSDSVILNCFIIGAGKRSYSNGIYLAGPGCLGILVKNNQIFECGNGVLSNSGGAAFSYNYCANCWWGLFLGDADVYQGNIVTGFAAAPFSTYGHPIGTENGGR
jgi:hypothetical protein